MNKYIILCIAAGVLTACSSSPRGDNHKINCDKMYLDSQAKLTELTHIFNAYQTVNVDLATKLSLPYRDEVAALDTRISNQKSRCWKDDERELDTDMAALKEDVVKIYGDVEVKKNKKREKRAVASAQSSDSAPLFLPPATPVEEIKPSKINDDVVLDSTPPPEE